MKILFICKHNIFRSRTAEILFNKSNKNKEYQANSAGIIKWNKKDLKGDKGFMAEKEICKGLGINLTVKSKSITSLMLKNTDIVIIVADDVPKSIFENEKSFNGKILVWKIKDVRSKDKNREKVALNTIKFIEKKINELVESILSKN